MAFKNNTPFASWLLGANGFLIGPVFLDGHEGRIHDPVEHCPAYSRLDAFSPFSSETMPRLFAMAKGGSMTKLSRTSGA